MKNRIYTKYLNYHNVYALPS